MSRKLNGKEKKYLSNLDMEHLTELASAESVKNIPVQHGGLGGKDYVAISPYSLLTLIAASRKYLKLNKR